MRNGAAARALVNREAEPPRLCAKTPAKSLSFVIEPLFRACNLPAVEGGPSESGPLHAGSLPVRGFMKMGSIAIPMSSDVRAEVAMLRAFVDFVAASPYSRTLQVMACHLRAAMLDESGQSRLSVSDLTRALDAPESTVKTSHRRLAKDGVLARTQVAGSASTTLIVIPEAASHRITATPEDACRRDPPPPLPIVQPLAHAPSVAPLADVPPAMQAPARQPPAVDHDTPARRPTPPGLRQLMRTLSPSKEPLEQLECAETPTPCVDLHDTPAPRTARHDTPTPPARSCTDPHPTPARQPPPSTCGDQQAPVALGGERSAASKRVFPTIQRAVSDAVMGAERSDTYPDTSGLAAEVAWTLFNGIYRDRPMDEGLRICLSTIRRGTWSRPKAFSPTEANSLRYK